MHRNALLPRGRSIYLSQGIRPAPHQGSGRDDVPVPDARNSIRPKEQARPGLSSSETKLKPHLHLASAPVRKFGDVFPYAAASAGGV